MIDGALAIWLAAALGVLGSLGAAILYRAASTARMAQIVAEERVCELSIALRRLLEMGKHDGPCDPGPAHSELTPWIP